MRIEECTKTVPSDDFDRYGTLDAIQRWADFNDVPRTAILRYAGCGTHSIEFFWMVNVPEEMDTMRHEDLL